MAKPGTLIVEPAPAKAGGHASSWQRLCDLRRQQLDAWEAAQPLQPGLVRVEGGLPPRG